MSGERASSVRSAAPPPDRAAGGPARRPAGEGGGGGRVRAPTPTPPREAVGKSRDLPRRADPRACALPAEVT
ncbi:hypothetical protein FISHEDRAFT_71031 [Fistulina hepatica ATCC 64428]|uniref:Uncharacterized protein n=1 Tax=Fistulina hepatica ATCC 64428 TaxID=1128425 RepID=A0A0D7AK54_9AGAR|nr:hypothetical protein FISHEDRAFT_71031 [Fistulina hepatica ATCC 64428]